LIVRGWHLVVPGALLAWLLYGWGTAVVVYLATWWATYVIFGGLRHGVLLDVRARNPLAGFGEEPPPTIDDPSPR
jgi:hypothetical protein